MKTPTPAPETSPQITASLISDDERQLLQRYFGKLDKRFASLRNFGRFGKSGAKVFLVTFGRGSLPFVVKLHTRTKIKEEFKAIQQVDHVFADCLTGYSPEYYGSRGALLYQHVGGQNEQQIARSSPLYEVAYNEHERQLLEPPALSRGQLKTAIKALLSTTCHNAHEAFSTKATSLLVEYERYLRGPSKPHRSSARLTSMLGRFAREHEFSYLGARIHNPLYALDRPGLKEIRTYKMCAVHGDLHPNNIVIDGNGNPRLIDFAWASKTGHFLKDFVLLECSLRFMNFPKHLSVGEHLYIDRMLMNEDGPEQIASLTRGSKLADAYARLALVLKLVRQRARAVGGVGYSFDEYLVAQFLVLFGLMRFEDYNLPTTLRALGMLAKHLDARGWL
jgi:hypothetical protein